VPGPVGPRDAAAAFFNATRESVSALEIGFWRLWRGNSRKYAILTDGTLIADFKLLIFVQLQV
jgi:hypothetical protein